MRSTSPSRQAGITPKTTKSSKVTQNEPVITNEKTAQSVTKKK
ncbi:hypothetical protein [Arsenophonus apicola]